MQLRRPTIRALGPFVKRIWHVDGESSQTSAATLREHVLPTGDLHVVFRLDDGALRIFDERIPDGIRLGPCVVGGPRTAYYAREVGGASRSLGLQLAPAASRLLFGVPAEELAGRHVDLEELWPGRARRLRERLLDTPEGRARIALVEAELVRLLPAPVTMHPAVAEALCGIARGLPIARIVRACGWSHRRVTESFRREIGIGPKRYARLLRFQRLLERVRREPEKSWTELALDAGYADQAHMAREFREMAGVTPRQYRLAAPRQRHHVGIDPPRDHRRGSVDFVQDRRPSPD